MAGIFGRPVHGKEVAVGHGGVVMAERGVAVDGVMTYQSFRREDGIAWCALGDRPNVRPWKDRGQR